VATRRVELGFEGGSVLRLTVDQGAIEELGAALGDGPGWRALSAEEGEYRVNLAKLLYTRLEPGEVARVGFGGS